MAARGEEEDGALPRGEEEGARASCNDESIAPPTRIGVRKMELLLPLLVELPPSPPSSACSAGCCCCCLGAVSRSTPATTAPSPAPPR